LSTFNFKLCLDEAQPVLGAALILNHGRGGEDFCVGRFIYM